MLRRHPVLLVCWAILVLAFALGLVLGSELLLLAPFPGAVVVAVCSLVVVHAGVLRYRKLYYVILGGVLTAASVSLVAAGSTIAIRPGSTIGSIGFVGLGTVNLVVGMLAWRALVAPTARRAALVGMVAVLGELVGMIFDAFAHHHVRGVALDRTLVELAFFGALAAFCGGVLACVVALAAFDEPDTHEVPGIRVV